MVREVGGVAGAATGAEWVSVGPRADAHDVENVSGGGDLRGSGCVAEWQRCQIRGGNGRSAIADRVSFADCRRARTIYGCGCDSRSARENGAPSPARVWREAGQKCGGGVEELGTDQGTRAPGTDEKWPAPRDQRGKILTGWR